MKWTIILLIVMVLMVSGCEDPDAGKTGKRIAQERLLDELDRCEMKFGNSDSDRREASVVYCNSVLELVEKKMDEGFFEGDGVYRSDEYDQKKEDILDLELTPERDLDILEGDILGDI